MARHRQGNIDEALQYFATALAVHGVQDAPAERGALLARMPEMSGVEFLSEAIKTCPQAKRVLLTAYADTQAAIDSINEIRLDYYLMKPWHPPEEKLYPVLDKLLDAWKAHVRLPYEGIRVAGTLWSLSSHQVKDFLTRHQIPYQWLDIQKDDSARKVVEGVTSETKLPYIFP